MLTPNQTFVKYTAGQVSKHQPTPYTPTPEHQKYKEHIYVYVYRNNKER